MTSLDKLENYNANDNYKAREKNPEPTNVWLDLVKNIYNTYNPFYWNIKLHKSICVLEVFFST